MISNELVLIIDYGSQYNQLIARRVREANVYCKIIPCNVAIDEIEKQSPKGIILSGGPASVYQKNIPLPDKRLFELGVPVLGICYGMQAMTHVLGGKVGGAPSREYGRAELTHDDAIDLFKDISPTITCWMSHGDKVEQLPDGFETIARTANTPIAAMAHHERKLFGVQFHPEVAHTQEGSSILNNFLFTISGCAGDWRLESFIESQITEVRSIVGAAHVVLGLSGGVDSSVTAALLSKALGKQLSCIFVDNGLLRADEAAQVEAVFRGKFDFDLHIVDARERFLNALKGVADPEKKRKIIGNLFIEVFEEEARKIGGVEFLAQGTLYPDVIESSSAFGGPSSTIKSHHNVGGLPEKMALKLIEPLRELFKDEVRHLGVVLGVPEELIWRHPFPGPGLAVRILGEVTAERVAILQQADKRMVEELHASNEYRKIWQALTVLLPIKTVGVMGDERTYEDVIVIRAVTSTDGMTADWARIPYPVLERISNRIINEVKGVNRVTYDLSSKPPATIEWE